MRKTLKLLSTILAYIPLAMFLIISIISISSISTELYVVFGVVIYFLAGFGLTSAHKEYQLVGVLSLINLALIYYLGESEIFGSQLTIVYIVVYYGIVYGISVWSRSFD